MITKKNDAAKANSSKPFYGKRDYYFHADEDFREDREWGKAKMGRSAIDASTVKTAPRA